MLVSTNKPALLGLNTAELRNLAASEGAAAFRGSQLAEWIYRRGANDIGEMVNLPVKFKERLNLKYRIGRSKTVKEQRAADGTIKLLLELAGGACVETVGLPYAGRYSCCVSTQAGCPIGCVFCSTGQSGFKRNLTAGEIIDQVLTIREMTGNPVDHVTFMGMGEPLLNYDATVKALKLLSKEIGISARHLTVSTIGYVPGIERLAAEDLPVTLAVSLHAPDDELRQRLIPVAAKWNIRQIIEASRHYLSRTGRRVTIEYCLIEGINDSSDQAKRLALSLKGLSLHVNLIPFNAAENLPFKAAPPERVREFLKVLSDDGIQVTVRQERGADIDAACGQLRRRTLSDK